MKKFNALRTNEVTELERNNQKLVRALAGECMVVLENDGTLPLDPDHRSIALYGRGARGTVKGGTGSGDVNSREVINIEAGLREAGFLIDTDRWLDQYTAELEEAEEKYQQKVVKIAEEQHMPVYVVGFRVPFVDPDEPLIMEKTDADIAVYVLSRNSGEGADRFDAPGDYQLSKNEEANIRFLSANYQKVILLLNVGGIIDTSVFRELPRISSILLIGQTGNIGGRIVADVLTGKSIPSGKLTDTWANSYQDYPSSKTFSHNNGDLDDEYYSEGIYVGYRYFDSFGVEPAYPFGYGKGYTEFSYMIVDADADESKVKVSVEVENVGTRYAGREVVQVYVSAPNGKLRKPAQELRGFAKTPLLQPGEKTKVTVEFSTASMASYDEEKAAWVLEEGDYLVSAGVHSRDTQPALAVTIPADVYTEKLRNVFQEEKDWTERMPEDPELWMEENSRRELFAEVKNVILQPEKIESKTAAYQEYRPVLEDVRKEEFLTLEDVKAGKATVEELTAQLTLEELACLCVGTKRGMEGSVIGNASTAAPGAAGDTYAIAERKVPNLVLADGPAGLRLQPHFKTTAEEELLPGGQIFGKAIDPFPANIPEDAVDYYQYCTAIPIATTLAQSWDMELIRKMGEIVGSEMKRFGVHLWLAPGMNLHRNPLCGRNFEYYSEDPLLSGLCAAADTQGVQSYGGQGTTIKHFAGNNQEDNRMFNNIHVSERAFRELYLKGFEIAVKTAQPLSVMTSYNRINGTHSANNHDLLQKVLRDEWGFEGVVMTDWLSSQDVVPYGMATGQEKYTYARSTKCVLAGNDIQMPGCEKNVTDLVEAVQKQETITLADVQFCAANLLRVVSKCC